MEPADIDWKNVQSRYVRDDAYERINAPMWADLSNPDSDPTVDDVAWFCRPDCRHPKTSEDFHLWTPGPKVKLVRSSSETAPLGERNDNNHRDGNLKRRGGVPSLLPSPKAKPSPKKFREDIENRDPNLRTTPPPPPLGRPNGGKTSKEAMKPSAEKRRKDEEGWGGKKAQPPRLKSTMSARNLFAGKDLLSQISEFCQELKKMALRKERDCSSKEAVKMEEVVAVEEEQGRSDLDLDFKKKDAVGMKKGGMALRIRTEEEKNKMTGNENLSVLREAVRSCPPTPQRFPSPSSHRLRSTKPTATTSSPLKKVPRALPPERGKLQQLDQSREEKMTSASRDEKENRASVSSDAEGRSVDMFWFLKPCTYLVK